MVTIVLPSAERRAPAQNTGESRSYQRVYTGVKPEEVERCVDTETGMVSTSDEVGETPYLWVTDDLNTARSHSQGAILELVIPGEGTIFKYADETGNHGRYALSYPADLVERAYPVDDPDFNKPLPEYQAVEIDGAEDLSELSDLLEK